MLVQTLLLTWIFLASGVYVFAIGPLLNFPTLAPPDPRSVTLDAVREVIWGGMTSGQTPATIARRIARDPVYRAVMVRNPDFRYSMIVDGQVIGTAPPVYWRRLGLDRLTRAKATADPAACVQLDRPADGPTGLGFVSYFNCSAPRYYELSGIRRAIDLPQPALWQVYARLFWDYSQSFLLPALAVFLICITILVVHIVMIQRVARLIRPLDGEGTVSGLSERGMPSEVLPLVRAVNRMIGHVADVDQRQRFFLSAAAHEMRTPLTVLRTRLEMMEQGDLKDKLVADVRRLTRLVNELLTLMSVRDRERPRDEVDLVVACRRAIVALEHVAMARAVVLRFDGEPVRIEGDGALVEIAVTNLVANAVAFSPEGGVVTIATRRDGRLSVADRGVGVSPDQIGMLFDPFVRFTKTPGGYGLGLTIVKAIADLHGAGVDVASQPEGGATFTLRFPAPPSLSHTGS